MSADAAFEAAILQLGGARLDVLRSLLAAGADVDRPQGELAEPPLLLAARSGDVDLYRVLRKAGADMKVRDGLGHTLIHSAALGGQVKILGDALAYKRLDPNARSEAGDTPFVLVLRRVTSEPAVQVEAKARKVLEVLLDAGAVPGPDALREARQRGFSGLSKRLRAFGVQDPDEQAEETGDGEEGTEPLEAPPPRPEAPKKKRRTRRIRRRR